MRPARPLAVLLLLALILPTAAACGSSHGARAWAASVCTTLSPWRTEIGSLTSRAQQQMDVATTPGQAKENLARLFAGAQDASERARAGVAKAGVPDVDDGKQIADGFTGSLAAMRDAYGRAASGIDGLATAPAKAFYAQVGTVVDQLNNDYEASSLDTSKLNSQELKQAFDEVPECR
ncbi:hypothetical protein BJ973_006886 [Actinoplanes tereljensis]|uniref:Lipoprotein n=1 Tax=Paractinoplanes tereljensis TaxID=571912 RepID=A0A919NKU9_9ACTN|nr:hypothetical protein [Actinoplanes tereljensis]GIF19844.1 hypothetical protein Ate02nite_25740 [Actinoplanes tereljensis]